MSHALEQLKAAWIRVICKSASIAPRFLLARVQLSICFPISRSHVHLTASLYLCPADCFQDILLEQARNSHWNMLAFLRHIKWHICSYLLRMKVPHLLSTTPMEGWVETLRASSAIMSDALQQTKAAPIGVICKSASISWLLACKAARVQLSTCFPIYIVFLVYTLHLPSLRPADCFQ